MPGDGGLSLLNVFEVETDGGVRQFLGFLDSVVAGARGIPTRRIVGECTLTPDGAFDAGRFAVNPEFVAALTDYMNAEASRSPEIVEQARAAPSQWLYVIDRRNDTPGEQDPPAWDILGCFAVDDAGQVVPNSFQYNREHRMIGPDSRASGVLRDRRFYDWLGDS